MEVHVVVMSIPQSIDRQAMYCLEEALASLREPGLRYNPRPHGGIGKLFVGRDGGVTK